MIMTWNPDFEIAALLLTVVFNVFYWTQRRLPLYQNHFFSRILGIEVGVILSDLVASYVSSEGMNYSVLVQNVANTVYFGLLAFLIVEFYFYTVSLTGISGHIPKALKIILQIPFLFMEVFILSSPVSGMVFSIDPVHGYRRGWGYLTIFGFVCIYIVLSVVFITRFRKNVAIGQLISIYTFSLIVFSGAFLQIFFFPYVLMTNGCSALAIAIIYLSLQNPDFYNNNMTGLFNTDAFMEIAKEKISQREKFSCFGIVMDRYATARKIYGKEHLDFCMTEIADYLKKLNPDFLTFYFHEGCFVILDPAGKDFSASGIKIQKRFDQPWKLENGEIYFHICTVLWPAEIARDNAAELMDGLQMAMDEAAEAGGSHINISQELIERMRYDGKVESALNQALENDSLEVYFQPIYSNSQGRISAAEALARLSDPELGFISPEVFIPKAEQNGSIMQLGRQIFEKTCSFIHDHSLDEMKIDYIEINLSPVQCLQEQLAEELTGIASKYDVPMSRVNLEITETATTDAGAIRENMKQLLEYGTTFSLDDYGTGFSNLINILKLPLHIVKIDKSIVWSYFNGAGDILPHVIQMFKNQHLEIVAEGVESQKMADELAHMGCDYEQGFYFSRPIPEKEFLEYVRKMNS